MLTLILTILLDSIPSILDFYILAMVLPSAGPAAKFPKGNQKGGASRSSDEVTPSTPVVADAGSPSGVPSGIDLQTMFDKFAQSFDTRLVRTR